MGVRSLLDHQTTVVQPNRFRTRLQGHDFGVVGKILPVLQRRREGSEMESLIYDSASSVQQLLDTGFEMPIHFAAVGTNGSVFAGTYQISPDGGSFDFQITVESSKPEGLTAPVNIMYVDCNGEAALVVLRPSEDEAMRTWPVA